MAQYCVLCSEFAYGQALVEVSHDPATRILRVKCPACGYYRIAQEHITRVQNEFGSHMHVIAAFIREVSLHSRNPVVLEPDAIPTIRAQAPHDAVGQVDRLLVNLAAVDGELAAEIPLLESVDYRLGYCEYPYQLAYLIRHLVTEGFVEITEKMASRSEATFSPQTMPSVVITIAGWRRVRELRQNLPAKSRQCFVAMSFADHLKQAYEGAMRPAIESTGFQPLRVDYVEHVGRIDDRIIVELNRSHFVVADVTGHRQGVYFEAGYALGRGIPVIWTCHEEQLSQAHFDTRQFNHLTWKDVSDLRRRLENRIRAVIS